MDFLDKPQLTILIASVKDREDQLECLRKRFTEITLKLPPELVRLTTMITSVDNKELSIGRKRQRLLQSAQNFHEDFWVFDDLFGEPRQEKVRNQYIVFFDDDDWPSDNYLLNIHSAIQKLPDCVGIKVSMTTNGARPQTCCHSLRYKEWGEKIDGYDYVRNVTHFNPVRLDLALQVGFEDLRYGEDKIYSDKLTALCRTEEFIEEPLFNYRYNDTIPFEQKYGIKK